MLKKIFINNFKCFTDFELSLESVNLFLGPNGSGKSGVFEMLGKIQRFIGGPKKAGDIFDPSESSKWQDSRTQEFGTEIHGNDGAYRYELALEYETEARVMQVRHERLLFNDRPLLTFESGRMQLYRDDHSEDSASCFGRDQSALAMIPPGPDNTLLTWFRRYMEQKLVILKIDPTRMFSESEFEEKHPSVTLGNFASWYRHISDDQRRAFAITANLRVVLDGFNSFRFAEAGRNRRILETVFENPSDHKRPLEYRFHDLSDGQRMLIVLHTLIYALRSEDVTLCMDEPENFLALAEIQPWLVRLYDFCIDGEIQALLASHHPQVIDYLAVSSGYWFERQNGGPACVRRIIRDHNGLSVSELVTGGWLCSSEERRTGYGPPPPKPKEPWTEPVTGMDFVYVPGGSFMMGQPEAEKEYLTREKGEAIYERLFAREYPRHEVTVDSFQMGKYPVTFDEYDQFCEDTLREKPDDGFCGRGRQPVVNVAWEDANAFAKWLSEKTGGIFRLPTEAEWEYAAGRRCRYSGRTNKTKLGKYAWYFDNSGLMPHPVGEKKPNEFGIHDMIGNVWEWCLDVFEDYSDEIQTNPICIGEIRDMYETDDADIYRSGFIRIVRGGGYFCDAVGCKSTFRGSYPSGSHDEGLGFRVVRDQRSVPNLKILKLDKKN